MTPENGHQPEASDTPDTALYIASMADELARLAKSHNLEALAYILDMARLEADQISKRWFEENPQLPPAQTESWDRSLPPRPTRSRRPWRR